MVPTIYQKIYPDKNNISILLEVEDILEGKWILKKNNSWELFVGEELEFTSKVVMTADTTWRMFTKNISKEVAKNRITIYGDVDLGQIILELTTVMK